MGSDLIQFSKSLTLTKSRIEEVNPRVFDFQSWFGCSTLPSKPGPQNWMWSSRSAPGWKHRILRLKRHGKRYPVWSVPFGHETYLALTKMSWVWAWYHWESTHTTAPQDLLCAYANTFKTNLISKKMIQKYVLSTYLQSCSISAKSRHHPSRSSVPFSRCCLCDNDHDH